MHLLKRVRNVLRAPDRKVNSWWPAGLAALAVPAITVLALSGWATLGGTVIADDESAAKRDAEGEREKPEEQARKEVEGVVRELDRRLVEERERGERRAREERDGDAKKREGRERRDEFDREADEGDDFREGKRKQPQKEEARRDKADLDFTDFQPQTDREERLLAMIRKLQAQLKEGQPNFKKDARNPDAEYKRAVEAKIKAAEIQKEIANRKEQEARQAHDLEYKQQVEAKIKAVIAEKEALLRKAQNAKRTYELENKTALQAKLEAAERAALEKTDAVHKERAAKDAKEFKGYKKESGKEAAVRKDGEGKKPAPDEIEYLRRVVKEQEAQLRKTAEALERLQQSVSKDRETENKKAPPQEGETLKKK